MRLNEKGRHFTFIVYPDSAPKNWKDILQDTGCEIAISPLHDHDISDEESKELKKPHWHVIISYSNTTTYNNVLKLTEKLNSPIPKILNSIKGMYRYFTHMDNPEKYQYDSKDIIHLNGFDVESVNALTVTQKYDIKRKITRYIRENDIKYYIQLLDKLEGLNYDWYNVAIDNTILFNTIIKSNNEMKRFKKFDDETGELYDPETQHKIDSMK